MQEQWTELETRYQRLTGVEQQLLIARETLLKKSDAPHELARGSAEPTEGNL